MESQPERGDARRQEIGERIAAIRARIEELRQAQQENGYPAASSEQFIEAQHHAALSEAAARQALAAGIEAFLHAAEAHDRAAVQHERTAAAGGDGEEHHRQRAAVHRESAAADRQRAETARSLLSGHPGDSPEAG